MAQHLTASGLEPVRVGAGELGLARLRYERPDVLVLDLMLPGLDGWSLIEQARAEGIGTPIVVVSARGTEHDRVHALQIGADDYLVKPFSMKELVARVHAAARRGVRGVQEERGEQLVDQPPNALVELVANAANGFEVLAGRVFELPVLVAPSRVDRAGVAAAHRDHDVGGLDNLVGERLRELLAHVDADLLHRLERRRVDLVRGGRAGRADVDAALRTKLDQASGHLAAAGIVRAAEQHLGLLFGALPLHPWPPCASCWRNYSSRYIGTRLFSPSVSIRATTSTYGSRPEPCSFDFNSSSTW